MARKLISRLRSLLASRGETKVGIAMILFSFALYFSNLTVLEIFSLKLFDMNFRMRGEVTSEKAVVIIAIDQQSQEKLGRWPWTREVMVQLVEKLHALGAKVIGLDIVFSYPEQRHDLRLANELTAFLHERPSYDPAVMEKLARSSINADVDSRLAAAFKAAGNVVPGYFFLTLEEEVEGIDLDNESDYKILSKSRFMQKVYPESGKKDVTLMRAVGAKPNIEPLTAAARYTGYFNIFPDEDGVVRRFLNVIEFNRREFPPAVLQMARAFFDGDELKISFKDYGVAGIYVGERFVQTDQFGRTYINFYGPEGMFKRISVSDVLENKPSADELEKMIKGKIAVVGATATGIYDIRQTPLGSMAGVEVEANFMQNIIDGRTLRKAGWHIIFDFASMFLLGVFLIYAMRRFKVFGGGILAMMLIVMYIYFQHYLFTFKLTVLDVLYPAITLILVYGGVTLYHYFIERKEKQHVRRAFEYYLSPTVIEQIMDDPAKLQLGGVRKNLTVFFSDLVGFSTISEQLTPEALVNLLNDYLTSMTDIILKYDGVVDKFEGDAIIAFFGAPIDYEDHAFRACRASIEMQETLALMMESWKEERKPLLDMRIGVNTGPVVIGNMGSKTRMDYTVMGDSVNLASRLEGVNKEYGSSSIISQYTYMACKDDIEVRELDTVRVVGKDESITIYELICKKGMLTDEQRRLLELFNKGMACYKRREWKKGIDAFGEALEQFPHDGPSLTYLERCLDYHTKPPASHWDGVHILKVK